MSEMKGASFSHPIGITDAVLGVHGGAADVVRRRPRRGAFEVERKCRRSSLLATIFATADMLACAEFAPCREY